MVKVKITEQVLLKRCDMGLRKHVAYIHYLLHVAQYKVEDDRFSN